ncbi:MAG: choice-of-anchor E domain-containing protein [Chitinophagaceae bacterium]
MRHIYPRFFTVSLAVILLICFSQKSYAQTCPDGSPQGGTAFDTTIAFASGVTIKDVKFPQFDPQSGMVTCVRLCITITGVVDTLGMQNLSGSAQTGTFTYIRKDTMRGPGLVTPLTNNANQTYGPYNLDPFDGSIGTGPDFYGFGDSTILTAQLCRTLNDSATIAQFYGTDSVTYNYTIDASTGLSFSGGSNSNIVLTSAYVNFHFEYCTCPALILPLNVNSFNANKLAANKVELKWSSYDDPFGNYHYEIEMSRNSTKFSSIGSIPKNTAAENYQMLYTTNGESGTYYFRVKQVYSNGYVRYSNIRQVIMEKSDSPKFSLYPNPSNGIVGIKFDNSRTGHFDIQIYNTQGQMVVNKGIVLSGSSYVQLGSLQSGTYWLRLTDKQSQISSVNQLIIK